MNENKYNAPPGPPPAPTYPPQTHQDAGYQPMGGMNDGRGPMPMAYAQDPIYGYYQPPQPWNQGPPPQGYPPGPYGPPPPGPYYQQGPPVEYYDDRRGGSGAAEGCCAALLASLACCCCLEMLF